MINWLTNLFRRLFTKKAQYFAETILLTDKQFAILQRLSGYFMLRQEELSKDFPEIAGELDQLYKTAGDSWVWFPRLSSAPNIEAEVKHYPTCYEIEGGAPGHENYNWEFRLYELGIRAKSDGRVIRRAKLLADRKMDEMDEDFLKQLSKI